MRLNRLHVRRELPVMIQTPNTLQHVVPGDRHRKRRIPGGAAAGDADAFFIVPGSVFFSVNDHPVAAVILAAQHVAEIRPELVCEPVGIRSMPGIEGCDNVHPALCRIGAVTQKIIDDILRNRRSEGRSLCALRFLNDMELLGFRGEQG